MQYDLIIVGAGPAGIFTALELLRKGGQKKIAIFEKGQPVEKRHCPKAEVGHCLNCKPYCHITTGFSGAGAFSDGKLSLSHEVGGELPELWNLTHPEVLLKIQSDYVNAGCDILTANMFGANRLKLEKTGHTVQEVVSQALKLAYRASGGKAAVALDIGPSGKLLKPFGDLAFDDAYELFKEEIIAGRDNADLVIIETMSDAYEAKAALLAAKENCDLPVIVTFTFDSTGKLLTGSNIPAALLLAESLGADAVGINCSLGPEQMESFVDEMLTLTNLPIVINPNAGLPVSVNGETSYPVGPEEFYAYMERFAEKGAAILGG